MRNTTITKPRPPILYEKTNGLGLYDATDLSRYYDMLAEEQVWASASVVFNACQRHISENDQSVLDVGIGSGLSSLPFKENGLEITGVDGSQSMLDQCHQKGITKTRILNLEKDRLPFPTSTFDITISNGVLYFLNDALKTIKEMISVTKAEGLIAFNYRENTESNIKITHLNETGVIIDAQGTKALAITHSYPASIIYDFLRTSNITILDESRFNLHENNPSPSSQNVPFHQIVARKPL